MEKSFKTSWFRLGGAIQLRINNPQAISNEGCKTTLTLLKGNNKITILEMLPTLSNGQEASHRMRDLEELEKDGVDSHTNAAVQKVDANGVFYKDADGNEYYVKADVIITATGQRPAGTDLENELLDLGIEVEKARDAIAMGNLRVKFTPHIKWGVNCSICIYSLADLLCQAVDFVA